MRREWWGGRCDRPWGVREVGDVDVFTVVQGGIGRFFVERVTHERLSAHSSEKDAVAALAALEAGVAPLFGGAS